MKFLVNIFLIIVFVIVLTNDLHSQNISLLALNGFWQSALERRIRDICLGLDAKFRSGGLPSVAFESGAREATERGRRDR